MNYLKIYHQLTNKKHDVGIITEKHHIIPKSVGGGNDVVNIVQLTPREHYVAHKLLLKIYQPLGGEQYKKMIYAFWRMSRNTKNKKVSARNYEVARLLFVDNNPNKDPARKRRFIANHKAGKYKYDYTKVSVTLKKTLSMLTQQEKIDRMKHAHNCDQKKRAMNIRKGKASLLSMETISRSITFWSYDDTETLTGYSYTQIKYFIRNKNGIGRNYEQFKYIKQYKPNNKRNNNKC